MMLGAASLSVSDAAKMWLISCSAANRRSARLRSLTSRITPIASVSSWIFKGLNPMSTGNSQPSRRRPHRSCFLSPNRQMAGAEK